MIAISIEIFMLIFSRLAIVCCRPMSCGRPLKGTVSQVCGWHAQSEAMGVDGQVTTPMNNHNPGQLLSITAFTAQPPIPYANV